MPGLDPGIHASPLEPPSAAKNTLPNHVDGRVKPGHDDKECQPFEVRMEDMDMDPDFRRDDGQKEGTAKKRLP
jgi:hypothetical protein